MPRKPPAARDQRRDHLAHIQLASVNGVDSSGSRLLRSRSPTNASSAMTSENEMGKKPTINMRNGINRSPRSLEEVYLRVVEQPIGQGS